MAELMTATGCAFVVERGHKTYAPSAIGAMPEMSMPCENSTVANPIAFDPTTDPPEPEVYQPVEMSSPGTGLRIIAYTSVSGRFSSYYDTLETPGPYYGATYGAPPEKNARFVVEEGEGLLTPAAFLSALGAALLSPEILSLLAIAGGTVAAYFAFRACFE